MPFEGILLSSSWKFSEFADEALSWIINSPKIIIRSAIYYRNARKRAAPKGGSILI